MSMTKLFTTVSALVLVGAGAALAFQPFGTASAPVAVAQEAAPAATADGARKTVGNLVIEGVNMLTTERTEVGAMLDQAGGSVPKLTDRMKQA